jgi:peroxiredoxin
MAALAPVCDFGWKAPDFRLPATDGRTLSLADVRGERGTLIVFICNHCPYVKAIVPRLVRDARSCRRTASGWRRSAPTTRTPTRRTPSTT